LLDNASKYSDPGTVIRVSVEREDEMHVRVAVSDEGHGIPPEYRELVFENFFQLPTDDSHNSRRGGAGLGLSIARRLVELQTGRLWIETPASRRGTTFAFTLPAGVEATADECPPAAVV